MYGNAVNALIERWICDIDHNGLNRFERQVAKYLDRSGQYIADPAVTHDDLVGDVVLHLLEKADKYDPKQNDCVDAWAITVIENKLVDSLRASTRRRPDGSIYAPKMPGPSGDTIGTQPYEEYERHDDDPEDFYCD